jgi:uncharacterized protein involved in type VI secretion and phage assembly
MFERRSARKMTPEDAHEALRRALSDAQRGHGPEPSRARLVALATRAAEVVGDDPMARAARASAERYLAALEAGRRIKLSAHKVLIFEPMDPAITIQVDAVFGEDDTFWVRELSLYDPDPQGDTDPE